MNFVNPLSNTYLTYNIWTVRKAIRNKKINIVDEVNRTLREYNIVINEKRKLLGFIPYNKKKILYIEQYPEICNVVINDYIMKKDNSMSVIERLIGRMFVEDIEFILDCNMYIIDYLTSVKYVYHELDMLYNSLDEAEAKLYISYNDAKDIGLVK